jgi:CHAT domain-containing protein/uncharacterized protein (DUF2164 family)
MKIYTIIVILSVFCNFVYAQNYEKYNTTELDSITNLLFSEGKYDEALICAEKTVEKTTLNDSLYTSRLASLGYIHLLLWNYEKAEEFLLMAINLELKKGKNSIAYSDISNFLGIYYYNMGMYDQVEVYYREAMDIRLKLLGKNDPSYLMILNNLAMLYQTMGKYEASNLLFDEIIAVEKLNKKSNQALYATYLNNQASNYYYLGDYEKAETLYLQAKDIRKRVLGEKHPSYAISISHLAKLYRRIQKFKAAEKMGLEAMDISAEVFGKNHHEYARHCNSLGLIYQSMGDSLKSFKYIRMAADINKRTVGDNNSTYAVNLYNLSGNHFKFHNIDSAIYYAKASLIANHTAHKSDFKNSELHKQKYFSNDVASKSISHLLNASKQKYLRDNNTATLTAYYEVSKSAIAFNKNIRDEFTDDDGKLRVLKDNVFYAEAALDAVLWLNSKEKIIEAFQFAEFNKSVLLSETFKNHRLKSISDLPDSILSLEHSLRKEMDKLSKEQVFAKEQDEKLKITQKINALDKEIGAFKLNLKKNYPKYYNFKYDQKLPDASEIMKDLDESTLFLEYLMSDSALYLFAVSKDEIELFKLNINLTETKENIKLLRKTLSDFKYIQEQPEKSFEEFCNSSHRLYIELLSTALKSKKQINTLIIVPDGELGHIPFEVFLQKEIKSKQKYNELPYLLNNYKISYNFSAALWKETKSIKTTKKSNMLAMAATYKNKTQSLNRSPYNQSIRNSLNELPAAKNEVEGLSKLFAGNFYVGQASNEKNFKDIAANYGIIHLAMHGILNQQTPILSSLAFTENGDSTEDNFLEAWEISHLKLNAQLVVLSACETGYGKFQQGEGVISLARAFMYAGVPSLVVSLWQVNDASTAEIMQLFYANLAKGMDKAEALRQAKLKYIAECKNPMMTHPAFWAAFVQIGDSRPVKIATKGGGNWYLLVGIGLFGLFGVIFALRQKKKIRF